MIKGFLDLPHAFFHPKLEGSWPFWTLGQPQMYVSAVQTRQCHLCLSLWMHGWSYTSVSRAAKVLHLYSAAVLVLRWLEVEWGWKQYCSTACKLLALYGCLVKTNPFIMRADCMLNNMTLNLRLPWLKLIWCIMCIISFKIDCYEFSYQN